MITFTTFVEIFTTFLFCIALGMLSAILAQVIHTYYQKRKNRKKRILYYQQRQKAELQKKGRMLNKLIGESKIIIIERNNLLVENEALRRELKLHGEIRSDMLSYSISQESENFDLRSKLDRAYKKIATCENELKYLTSIRKAELEEEAFVELDTEPDAVMQAKGVSFEEIAELPRIMQGISGADDMDAAVIVAKTNGTVLFEQLQEQIKDSKLHIGSLIDRLEERMESPKTKRKDAESYFYENTGFSIRDFLPPKTA